jgi:predicted DNA-binding transcriptional regulator YafY
MGVEEENGSITVRPMRLATIYLVLAEGIAQTAQALADATGAGRRTIYRDIQLLRSAGLAIEGTPRLGYMLDAVPELTPLFLTRVERAELVTTASTALKAKLRGL